MILTCPECATSYFVPDERLGPNGRRVRCQSCAHTWRAVAEEPLDLVVSTDGAAAAEPSSAGFGRRDENAPETLADAPAPELPRAFRARAEHQRRMRRVVAVGAVWAGLACIFLGLMGAAFLFRVQVVELYPRAAAAYAMVGVPVNPVGLEFEAVKARPAPNRPGQVLISGALRNVRDRPIAAPVMRVALLDAEGREIGHQMLTVPGPPIQPGAVLGFATLAPDPQARAADIGVAFAPDTARLAPLEDIASPTASVEASSPASGLRGAIGVEPGMQAVEAEPLDVAALDATPLDFIPLDSGPGEALSASHHG